MLVVREVTAVAHCTEVVGELPTGRVEVQVADVGVAPVSEAVDDERRHPRQRPRLDDDTLVLESEPDRQLALENVEKVAVPPVDVQLGAHAVRAEARPRRVELVRVGEDLDPPGSRVAHDLAFSAWN